MRVMHPRFIVGQRVGRLGNQAFLLANLLACHQATGIGFCHPVLGNYGKYFKGTADDYLARFPGAAIGQPRGTAARLAAYCTLRGLCKLKLLARPGSPLVRQISGNEELDLSDENLQQTVRQSGHIWLLGSWLFRYPTITTRFFPLAKEFFELTEPYHSRVATILSTARRKTGVLIGVHIRQTDFKHHEEGRFFFTTEQYGRVMREAQRLFGGPGVRFMVVSDEKKHPEYFPGLPCEFGSGSDIEDMYCLGGCDYLISSAASSFSLWPAFLNRIPSYRIKDPDQPLTREAFVVSDGMWKIADV